MNLWDSSTSHWCETLQVGKEQQRSADTEGGFAKQTARIYGGGEAIPEGNLWTCQSKILNESFPKGIRIASHFAQHDEIGEYFYQSLGQAFKEPQR